VRKTEGLVRAIRSSTWSLARKSRCCGTRR